MVRDSQRPPNRVFIGTLGEQFSKLRGLVGKVAPHLVEDSARRIRLLEEVLEKLVRQADRYDKWERRHAEYHVAGLNGKRAVERRARQRRRLSQRYADLDWAVA